MGRDKEQVEQADQHGTGGARQNRRGSSRNRRSSSRNRRSTGTAAGQPNPGGAGGQAGKKPVIVWVKEADKVSRVRVATGAIDGSNAEINLDSKKVMRIILSMTLGGKSSTTTAAAAPQQTTAHLCQHVQAEEGR